MIYADATAGRGVGDEAGGGVEAKCRRLPSRVHGLAARIPIPDPRIRAKRGTRGFGPDPSDMRLAL